jgi:glucokinase
VASSVGHHHCSQDAAAITSAALRGDDPLAQEAVDVFMGIVGAEAGAMSLRCLAKGDDGVGGDDHDDEGTIIMVVVLVV